MSRDSRFAAFLGFLDGRGNLFSLPEQATLLRRPTNRIGFGFGVAIESTEPGSGVPRTISIWQFKKGGVCQLLVGAGTSVVRMPTLSSGLIAVLTQRRAGCPGGMSEIRPAKRSM